MKQLIFFVMFFFLVKEDSTLKRKLSAVQDVIESCTASYRTEREGWNLPVQIYTEWVK